MTAALERGYFIQPTKFRLFFQRCQSRGGGVIAHMFLFFVPGISAKPEHVVIHETDASKRLGKYHFLLIRWIESKSIGAFNVHLKVIRILFKRFNIKYKAHLISPYLKKGVLWRF